MTSELSPKELLTLFNAEYPQKINRLKEINSEFDTRLAEMKDIQARIVSGEVRSLEELDSITKDLENHRARVNQLKSEADLLMVDFIMDVDAINKTAK